MKNFKVTGYKVIILVLLILCVLSICFIFKSHNTNKNELGKTIVFSKIYIDNEGNIDNSQFRIFKIDSSGKCASCKIILNRDIEILKQIAIEITSYDTEEQYSNVKLQDYTLYFDDNQYNGLSEEEIKNKKYSEFEEIGLNNTEYKVYTSFSEI